MNYTLDIAREELLMTKQTKYFTLRSFQQPIEYVDLILLAFSYALATD